MEEQQLEQSSSLPAAAPEPQDSSSPRQDDSPQETPSMISATSTSSWAKNHKPQSVGQEDPKSENAEKINFAHLTSDLGLLLSPKSSQQDGGTVERTSAATQYGVIGFLAIGIVDSSRSAVKVVQIKARRMVSQNKRRYQVPMTFIPIPVGSQIKQRVEGGFDLDMTYITANTIAMGFPAGDMSSGFFGYVEGFYRNHMEEVIRFFETHHKGKYKVYNLCSERLYDASLFQGKVACFPFDDHNCPTIQLIMTFYQSAYSWLKEDIENVVVVHCKAGMARTGLMISSLLLYMKLFPTAEESIEYYNQKRCVDGKGLVLPSQIRYVKYFERILTYFNGETQPGRRCMLRGFRLHKCPYWSRPSITISNHYALSSLTYEKACSLFRWLNTTMMENRKILDMSDLDGFDKRKLPSPGFQVEVVLVDYDGSNPPRSVDANANKESNTGDLPANATTESRVPTPDANKDPQIQGKDEVFSDGEAEEPGSSKCRNENIVHDGDGSAIAAKETEVESSKEEAQSIARCIGQVSLKTETKAKEAPDMKIEGQSISDPPGIESTTMSEFKAIAADASVFSFGDEEDYEKKEECGICAGLDLLKLVKEAPDMKIEGQSISDPPGIESTTMSEFKAIAADASVFSFGDEEDYESE